MTRYGRIYTARAGKRRVYASPVSRFPTCSRGMGQSATFQRVTAKEYRCAALFQGYFTIDGLVPQEWDFWSCHAPLSSSTPAMLFLGSCHALLRLRQPQSNIHRQPCPPAQARTRKIVQPPKNKKSGTPGKFDPPQSAMSAYSSLSTVTVTPA